MTSEIELDQALARAVLCRTLKLGLQRPAPDTLRQLFCEEGRLAVQHASRVLDKTDTSGLDAATAELSSFPKPYLPQVLDVYDKLFGHTAHGCVCPYETEYGGDALFLQAQLLADLRGFYLAFGLEPDETAGERADHIAVEWEYLEFLSEKEAYAIEYEDTLMLNETRKAYRLFLRDHLARFGRAFARSLVKEDSHGFYGALGELCNIFIEIECKRLAVTIGPEFIALRSESLDDAPMACGSSSELVQIE